MPTQAVAGVDAGRAPNDLEAVFRAHYERVAGVIARVTRDPARAEELAVEVFLKFQKDPEGVESVEGWLYRTAVRTGLDELRRQGHRRRYEGMLRFAGIRREPTPEELHQANQEQDRVRAVLGSIGRREAGMLLLRSQGLSYSEVAAAMELNEASIGTLISRAQQVFRKEYIKRYGTAN